MAYNFETKGNYSVFYCTREILRRAIDVSSADTNYWRLHIKGTPRSEKNFCRADCQ